MRMFEKDLRLEGAWRVDLIVMTLQGTNRVLPRGAFVRTKLVGSWLIQRVQRRGTKTSTHGVSLSTRSTFFFSLSLSLLAFCEKMLWNSIILSNFRRKSCFFREKTISHSTKESIVLKKIWLQNFWLTNFFLLK